MAGIVGALPQSGSSVDVTPRRLVRKCIHSASEPRQMTGCYGATSHLEQSPQAEVHSLTFHPASPDCNPISPST